MKIRTLKRMMIARTIAQKDEVVTVAAKEGRELVGKGYAVEVESPQADVEKSETKAKASKDKAE